VIVWIIIAGVVIFTVLQQKVANDLDDSSHDDPVDKPDTKDTA